MTPLQIATAFSNGAFAETYEYLENSVEWIIPGENDFKSKADVVAQCEQVAAYFKSVTTDFKTTTVISDERRVAIAGTATFKRAGKTINFIQSCDIYEFNSDNKVSKITSYCIQSK